MDTLKHLISTRLVFDECMQDSEVLDAEESFAIRSYGHIRREKRLTKYNIMKVAPYKGYLLPKEPFLIVEKNNEKGETMEVREACEPCRHWWMPEDEKALKTEEMRLELDNFGTGQKYIQNGMGQRLVIETGTMGFFSRFFGILKVGSQEAGVCYWMDEPENGWDGFNNDKGKQGKFLNVDYADKWHWIYLDKWDLPWSGDDEDEKRIYFPGGFSVAKDDIPLFRIAEKGLMKQYKSYVPTKIRLTEKNEIRQWVWKGLVNFTELKLKLGWMSKQHPKYFDDEKPGVTTLVTLVEKPFEDLLIDLAHASPSKGQLFTGERAGAKEEAEAKMVSSCIVVRGGTQVAINGIAAFGSGQALSYVSAIRVCPMGGDPRIQRFGKKRYVLKKPDDPVESIARVEMNVRLKHVLPLMRYTSDFKACVPINSLELPLRSNLQIILKESGNGEQFNYTVDRLTNLISIGVLASKPPGPICAVTLLLLQLVNFANRFWTNKVSAEQVAKRLEQEDNAPDPEPEQDAPEKEPLTGGGKIGKKKKLSPMKQRIQKKREKMANKTLVDSFLEVEVFKMFLQSLVLFLLAGGQFGWMPGPICALMCILVCVFTMIFMNVSTFRKEMNKQIDSISQSVTEMYRMYRGYENSVRTWLGGENFLGVTFINFDGAHASDLENVADVNFVVPELGLRLTVRPLVFITSS
ncbi:unnamed protein product [Cladocopium goreaui]|uniref:Radial spoke head 1-like n=1 Tax=Cladocopium goreaui TaxID=2562237 RepID=A0A9P1BNE7_9DINO|nr:unnamed protein product [Cladocopium goreaui]